MGMKRVPNLDWPRHLFLDVGIAQIMDEQDACHFSEVADIGALTENVVPGDEQASIVRYLYGAGARQLESAHSGV